jgi:hypothetical protein
MSANTNLQALSSGGDVYAKKRKARQEQIAEVTFDPEARKYDSLLPCFFFIFSLPLYTSCHCRPASGGASASKSDFIKNDCSCFLLKKKNNNKKKTLLDPWHKPAGNQQNAPRTPPVIIYQRTKKIQPILILFVFWHLN